MSKVLHRALNYTFTPIGVVQGWSPEISLISLEEEQRILELIAANTWPQGWTGTEPLTSEFEEPRDVVQLSFDCGVE